MPPRHPPVIRLDDESDNDSDDPLSRVPPSVLISTPTPTRASFPLPGVLKTEETAPRSSSEMPSGSGEGRPQSVRFLAPPGGADGEKEKEKSPRVERKKTPVAKKELPKWRVWVDKLLAHRMVAWVGPKIGNFEEMKPVIRSAVAAWIGLLFILIRPTEEVLGTAGFFALVVAFICPPSLPFIQSLEQNFFLFLFVGLSWAWVSLAAFIVTLVRTNTIDEALLASNEEKFRGLKATNPEQFAQRLIFEGTYLQAKPSIVCGVFLGVGVGFFAWFKIRTAPAPWTFALVLGCVLADVSLTIIPLFPTPYYTSGLLFMLPMSIQCGISILCSTIIFPQSVSSSFSLKLNAVLSPLSSSITLLSSLFEDVLSARSEHSFPTDAKDAGNLELPEGVAEKLGFELEEWARRGVEIREKLVESVGGLGPLKGLEMYLERDLSYSRLGGADLGGLFKDLQTLQLRSGGQGSFRIAFFFDVVTQAISHTHLNSSAFSVHTPGDSQPPSRSPSRPSSIFRGRSEPNLSSADHHMNGIDNADNVVGDSNAQHIGPSPLSGHTASEGELSVGDDSKRHSHMGHRGLLGGLFTGHRPLSKQDHRFGHSDRSGSHMSLIESLRRVQQPVGMYESQRYMNVEKSQDADLEHVSQQLDLLAESASPLVLHVGVALQQTQDWITRMNKDRSMRKGMWSKNKQNKENETAAKEHVAILQDLEAKYKEFKQSKRYIVLDPYRHLFDPSQPPLDDVNYRKLKHRGLYWDLLFQYHLMEFSAALLAIMRRMEELDKTRKHKRVWVPKFRFNWKDFKSSGDATEDGQMHDEVDPNEDLPNSYIPLGAVKRRDPEVQPYDNAFLDSLRYIDKFFTIFASTQFLFAVKAGVLTVLVALPAFIQSSAGFFYYNRGLWAIIMCQMTLALYAGETAAAWFARAQGTFWGCLTGMIMWYISTGTGEGNAYGLAAVCAVTFPALFMIRLYFPAPPLTVIIYAVSAALVVGYSWINASLGSQTNATWGWDVTWRRFVLVLIGITAAWIFALLPPKSSGKEQIRITYAHIISQLGSMFCDVISEAADPLYVPDDLEAECGGEGEQDESGEKQRTRGEGKNPIKDQVLAMKRKLVKTGLRHAAIGYEFSLKGRWPTERYQALQDVLVDLTALVSQLHHVLAQMNYPWRRALLERARLVDSMFIGDVLAIISMCATSIRAGTPLPQVTPAPLVVRQMGKQYGISIVVAGDESNHVDIPKLVTADVLESEEYLRYALATTTVFSIVRRIDKLLLVVKTLVGEEFHIELMPPS